LLAVDLPSELAARAEDPGREATETPKPPVAKSPEKKTDVESEQDKEKAKQAGSERAGTHQTGDHDSR